MELVRNGMQRYIDPICQSVGTLDGHVRELLARIATVADPNHQSFHASLFRTLDELAEHRHACWGDRQWQHAQQQHVLMSAGVSFAQPLQSFQRLAHIGEDGSGYHNPLSGQTYQLAKQPTLKFRGSMADDSQFTWKQAQT